jgi:NDP-sugar pyrophosphorylase family protein
LAFSSDSRYSFDVATMDTAVVLAAGRGTRMGDLTAATPKPLLAVAGRPLIEHVAAGIAAAGLRRLVVVTGYLGEQIEAALGDGSELGIEILYERQDGAEGTARALLLAERWIRDRPFLLSWSDVIVEPRVYGEMVRGFAAPPCDVLLAVNEVEDPWRGAAVDVDSEWRVTRLEEKPARGTAMTCWNNAGILACAPSVLDYARRLAPSERGEFELPQAVAQMVREGRVVRARPVLGFWCDVGTPRDLEWADAQLRSSPAARRA